MMAGPPTIGRSTRITTRNLAMMDRPKLLTLFLPLLAFACCGPEHVTVGTDNPVAATSKPDATADRPPEPKPNAMTESNPKPHPAAAEQATTPPQTETATFGGGCFWCTEAVLEQLDGVVDVESGYTGGAVDNPSYEQVCGGNTGHAEVVKVTFDPSIISYETLLEWFFRSHNPTTLNQQGADHGTQYRSAIFFHSKQQHETAVALIT